MKEDSLGVALQPSKALPSCRIWDSILATIRFGRQRNNHPSLWCQTVSKLLLFSAFCHSISAGYWCVTRKSVDLLVVYEHLSIPPVRLCRLLHPRCKIWLHFHEYSSPEEVKGGGFARYCWAQVEKVINDLDLYTQTNVWRLNQFQKDFECDTPCIEKGMHPQHPA